ncbi:hypothetical protein L211DRAFT_848973 [Terfezia boudieri ATCC MYA-4762]|uniref:Uncharacterized protein n=1 Tax=Terfezia boudieri ATCC MYA-4762 TaxID=1051890 RepID=A0A3N4LMT2_9PEZI|nr:hypothetical protein L211DRAFT_848973 [Terfezia boudieri ATCC MYA-4762]
MTNQLAPAMSAASTIVPPTVTSAASTIVPQPATTATNTRSFAIPKDFNLEVPTNNDPTNPTMQNIGAESSNAATPGTVVTSGTAVTSSHPTKSDFLLSKEFRSAEVKLSNIEPLAGQHNYEDWSSQMILAFDAMNVLNIVVNGSSPTSDSSAEEHEGN